jgi:hypothetical protein
VWHSPFKLYLYPESRFVIVDTKELKEQLKSQQFIGTKISKNRYSTGDKFLSLLTFMGCSPDIELEPQDDKPFCYIEIESSESTRFISGVNTKPAPCPKCRSAIKTIPKPDDGILRCPYCDFLIEVSKLNWRKSALLANSCIVIGNIYELEAVPNDELLLSLENLTSIKWKAAYIREKEV